MKITSTLLSIPPYLSTTWKNISSLHVRSGDSLYTLIVLLQDGTQIEVPDLSKGMVDEIFEAHARSVEEERVLKNPLGGPFSFSLPIKSGGSFESLATSMQHNPEQSNLPPIPPEVLKKIVMIARAFGLEEASFSKPEPNCNCVYCQMNRALQGDTIPVEEVSQEDLKFRDWEIQQTDEKLYSVTNPLDVNECYTVFLGTPIGCTCGSKNCEHIRAVLNS